jgi:hypothetical protein
MGEWELLELYVDNFEELSEGTIRSDVSRLREIPASWKEMDDPIGELAALRHGERPQ